jgi:hypothetical protein
MTCRKSGHQYTSTLLLKEFSNWVGISLCVVVLSQVKGAVFNQQKAVLQIQAMCTAHRPGQKTSVSTSKYLQCSAM